MLLCSGKQHLEKTSGKQLERYRRWNDEHPNPLKGRFHQNVISRSTIKKHERTNVDWASLIDLHGSGNFRKCQVQMETRLKVLKTLAERTKNDNEFEMFFQYLTKELNLKKGGLYIFESF